MSNPHKRKGKSKFVMIDGYVKRSAAWKALTPVERCAYIEVKWRYDGTNNGRIGLGCRDLADELSVGRNTANLALGGLQEKGFIAKAKSSGFNIKNRAVTEWRLTEYRCDVTSQLPTKDFARWGLSKNSQSYPADTQSYPQDTTGVKTGQDTPHSPIQRTVRPVSEVSQSYPADTYRYTMGGETDAA